MLIHLVRHGIAVDRDDPSSPPEAERPLTQKGRERTKEAAAGMRVLGVQPCATWVSPYVRAQQTARIVRDVLGAAHEPLLLTQALLPEADPQALVAELRDAPVAAAMCVGHAPHVDRFLATLLGVPAPITRLKKAGLATLELGDGPARLLGVYPPAVLRLCSKAS